MFEHTAGLPLTLTAPGIWKGTNKSNGQLELIHNYHLEVGYSSLVITAALQAELTTAGVVGVPFGNGAWYDRYLRTTVPNKVWAGIPTAANAVPKLAGIIKYDAAIGSLQPAAARGLNAYNKGVLVKRGFLRYKTGKAAAAGAAVAYADIDDSTMCFFLENSTGDPVFAVPTGYGPSLSVPTTVGGLATAINAGALVSTWKPTLANCTYAGRIVQLYPEDESVLVELDF